MPFHLQGEGLPRHQQPLDQGIGRCEVDGAAPLDHFQADGTDQVGLSPTRQAEGQQVLGPLDEAALAEGGSIHRTGAGRRVVATVAIPGCRG